MRVAVLSDTHLTSLTSEFQAQVEVLAGRADHIFHLGDSVCREVLDFLNTFSLFAVAGNMDSYEIRRSWPDRRIVSLNGFRIGLIHGHGAPNGLADRVRAQFEDLDCICFGHSHQPFNQVVNGVLMFNPGSAQPHHGGRWGLLEIGPEGLKGRHFSFGELP